MHRAILESCLPLFVALVVSFVLLRLCVLLSGARWDFSRLRNLHRCQEGGVQAFSFVATLPVFVLIVAFIVQVSQLMIGMIGVHYAAYAGARAASVWLPAEVPDLESVNKVLDSVPPDSFLYPEYQASNDQLTVVMGPTSIPYSGKYRRIWTATMLGLGPICPSHDKGMDLQDAPPPFANSIDAAASVYAALVPTADRGRVFERMQRKLSWGASNTLVLVEWRDLHRDAGRHTRRGPTYNPYDHDSPDLFPYELNEVGWQDPITVHVYHKFSLLPGPGKLLARLIEWNWNTDSSEQQAACGGSSGRLPCRHSVPTVMDLGLMQRVLNQQADSSGTAGVVLHASATMNNDGLIPLYREQQYDY